MSIAQSLLPEFDHEIGNTRKTLERVPDDRFAWQPHGKSMSLGRLASHLAELPWWATMTLERSEYDLAPGGVKAYVASNFATRQEVLAHFDATASKARAGIAAASDAELFEPWTLKNNGHVIFTMPKVAVLRSFVLNHLIHHRGQLTVYLRLNDVPVPGMYGPSADEAFA